MNQTVYPYGTGGSLPSSIGIINDLKTGGADKALAAEQGKVIGEILFSNEPYPSDNLTPISTYNDKQFKADSSQVGKSLSSVSTYTQSGSRNYRIPVRGAYSITYRKFNSGYEYGCLFLDASDMVIEGVVGSSAEPNMKTIGVPDGAVSFIWSYMPSVVEDENERVCTVSYIKDNAMQEEIDNLGASVESISAEIGKTIVTEASFAELTHVKDGKQLLATSAQIGTGLNDVPTANSSVHVNVKVPVENCSKIEIMEYKSSYGYGSLFVDENDIVLAVFSNNTDTYGPFTLVVPENAKFFVYSYSTASVFDKAVTRYSKGGILSQLDEFATKEPSELVTGKSPDLILGRVDNGGVPVSDNKYVITEPIYGGFSLILADGWRVYEGHLYDRNGKIVSYQHINPNVRYTSIGDTWSGRVYMATDNTVPEYGLRLVLCKSDQSAIADGERPVSNFVLLDGSKVKRWVPEDLPNYGRAQRRIDYFQNLRWTALAKVPDGVETPTNTYFCLPSQVHVGVPYSDVAETRTYVPNNISLRTFMTATKNRRSLLYTEDLLNNVSKYGKTYKTGVRSSYYGSVCSGFTGWVMDSDILYLSGEYGSDRIPGLSAVSYNGVDDLRPLDFVWYDGHISMVSDIYKDEYGEVKYIVWAEMRAPYPYRTPYTPEQFNARVASSNATIHRWDGWANINEPDASEYSQYLLGDTRKEPKFNEDIMCFAGDYAAFAEGDIIHLNARRNSVYTGVELYKDDVLLQTIDITGLSADTIVTPNTEDWVDVNLTTLNLSYGKYKARMTDGTNKTDYTYFEVIGITMSATKSGNTVTIAFGSSNGTPVSVEQVKDNGFPNTTNGKYHAITEEEVEAGTMTLNWAYNSTYKYLLMLVKGDYGTVVKRISHPSA